jgi:hypothetical protein
MVLLVLKLIVSSHPLKLEGVLCIYIFLLHEGQAEYHFAMFFLYARNKQLTFIALLLMIFCLCYFSCYNMAAKFYCQNYISYAHVITSLCFTSFDQDCVGACHLKNYCFVITLVEKGPMVPVHLGHSSRLPNRDQLLGTNAGPGSSTNRDR